MLFDASQVWTETSLILQRVGNPAPSFNQVNHSIRTIDKGSYEKGYQTAVTFNWPRFPVCACHSCGQDDQGSSIEESQLQ